MGERIRGYFADGIGRITSFVPELVAALVILAIGYVVSRVVAGLARRLLLRVGFDRFVAKRLHPRATATTSPSVSIGSIVFWVGMLITISMATRALGLVALAGGIDRILAFLPHVFVAAIIVAIGVAVGNLVAQLLGDVTTSLVARGARAAILVLAVFMALDQLGVAHGIVMTAFTLLLGAAAIAVAIAFGVGNRQLAGEYTRRWTQRIGGSNHPEPTLPKEPELPVQH